jgi:pyruvoyl-dependent arginine decarboxylase (PvlArgDC)
MPNFPTGTMTVMTIALTKGIGHGKTCTPNFDHRVIDTKTTTMQAAEAIQEAEEIAEEIAEEMAEEEEEAELEEKCLAESNPNY